MKEIAQFILLKIPPHLVRLLGKIHALSIEVLYKPYLLLAHLSRRLIGELIIQAGIRRPSTFSNDISSEVMKPILTKFHI